MNHEHSVWSVAVAFRTQLTTELKKFILDVLFKDFHIRPVPLITFENAPCLKQIFCRGYLPI
ncbi:MAG: hypothetical protein AAB850_02210 [Patescibacteria group bacterium]